MTFSDTLLNQIEHNPALAEIFNPLPQLMEYLDTSDIPLTEENLERLVKIFKYGGVDTKNPSGVYWLIKTLLVPYGIVHLYEKNNEIYLGKYNG